MRMRRGGPDPAVSLGRLDFPPPGHSFEGPIVLSGWVAFPSGPTARVEAWLDEMPLGRARMGIPRADVVVASDAPDAAVAGFELRAGCDAHPELRPGPATLRVAATSLAGERFEFDPVPIVVAEPPSPSPSPAVRPVATPTPGTGRSPRLLAFTNVLSHGGASLYLFDLLREARRQGRIEPTVVSAVDGPLRGELEALGVEVHIASPSSLESLVAHLDRVEELAAWAAPGEFDLVLVNTTSGHTVIGAALAARLGLPAVWTIHESFELEELWGGLGADVRAHSEAMLAAAALAIFEADGTRQMYRRVLDQRRCRTVPYGLDPAPIDRFRASFDRAGARAEEGIPADADLLLCVGTVEPRKAQIPLALAFEQVVERFPDAHLAIVGVGSRQASPALVERVKASAWSERFHLVGITDQVQRWFGMADLFVCASDVESLPRSVLEAMAWETPVLATSVFGLPELIADGQTGWLCEDRDVAALAAGLERALDADPAERRRIGAASRRLVESRHALDGYARAVSDLLDGVLDGGRTGDGLSTMPPQ